MESVWTISKPLPLDWIVSRMRNSNRVGMRASVRAAHLKGLLELGVLWIGFAASACSHPTDLVSTGAIVYGRVTFENGQPAAGTQVSVELLSQRCPASIVLSDSALRTDDTGKFRAQLLSINFGGVVCARATATSGSLSAIREDSVMMHASPFDSVRVDLVLR